MPLLRLKLTKTDGEAGQQRPSHQGQGGESKRSQSWALSNHEVTAVKVGGPQAGLHTGVIQGVKTLLTPVSDPKKV